MLSEEERKKERIKKLADSIELDEFKFYGQDMWVPKKDRSYDEMKVFVN